VKPVLWSKSIEMMLEAGVNEFTEAGTPPVLAPIIGEIRKQFRGSSALDITAAENPEPPAPQPRVPPEPSFRKMFSCSRSAIAGSLGNGIAGPRLVRALAKAGVLSFIDTEGMEVAAVDDALAELSADAEISGRFGAGVYADLDTPDADEPLVDLFLKHDIRVVEAKGYHEPSQALLRYRDKNARQTRGNRVIAHVASLEVAHGFILGRHPASDWRTAPSLPAPTHTPWVDALCVDLHSWRSKHPAPLSLLQTVLSWRDDYRSYAHRAPFFVGAAGGSPGLEFFNGLLTTTVDFVSASSIYLLADEASLDRETREAIRSNTGAYEDTPDWHFPELGSRSLSFVRDRKLGRAMERLQALYLTSTATAKEVGVIAQDVPEPYSTRLRDLAAALGGFADPILFRACLRRGLKTVLFPGIVACDASPAMFMRAMLMEAPPRNQRFGADHLADLLCPVASDRESRTEKKHA